MVQIVALNKETQPSLKVQEYISAFKEVFGTPHPGKFKIGDYIRTADQNNQQKFFEIIAITLDGEGVNYNIKDNNTGTQYLLSQKQISILQKIGK